MKKTFGIAAGFLVLVACVASDETGMADGGEGATDDTTVEAAGEDGDDAAAAPAEADGEFVPSSDDPVERVESQLGEVDRLADEIDSQVAETNRRLDEADRQADAIEAEIERIQREQRGQ